MKHLKFILCLAIFFPLTYATEVFAVWQTKPENNLSNYFKNTDVDAELYLDGNVVRLPEFKLDDPQDKIIILFNHGTRRWSQSQECRPENFGVVIEELKGTEISNKKVMAFHLCSFSYGAYNGNLTPIRATEIKLAVSYFLKLGVRPGNIFIFGQSRGGWSTLYFAAKNKLPKLGGYIVYAPAICGPRPLKCWYTIDGHIKLFKSARIDGILYSHSKDRYFTPKEHKFATKVKGLTLRTGFCGELTERRAHGFYRRSCSSALIREVRDFISKRIASTGENKATLSNKDTVDKLERKLKYIKEQKIILDQIRLLQKKLEILKLEFETAK